MKNKQVQVVGPFHIASAQGELGFVSWGKMGPIHGDDPISETGEHVWFQFGVTRDEAVTRLLSELGLKC